MTGRTLVRMLTDKAPTGRELTVLRVAHLDFVADLVADHLFELLRVALEDAFDYFQPLSELLILVLKLNVLGLLVLVVSPLFLKLVAQVRVRPQELGHCVHRMDEPLGLRLIFVAEVGTSDL